MAGRSVLLPASTYCDGGSPLPHFLHQDGGGAKLAAVAEKDPDQFTNWLTELAKNASFGHSSFGGVSRSLKIPSGSSKPRKIILYVYKGCKPFEYLVLPVDPSSNIVPRVLLSPIPPHLTISSTVDKIFKHWGRKRSDFIAARDSLIALAKTSPPVGATFTPNSDLFIDLRYLHESWATCYVPPRFLGLEGPGENKESDDESDESDESDENAANSTMEWEWEEPQRRLLPHELEQEPDFEKMFRVVRRANDEDDAISCDSHITGVEDPEEYAKASVARGDHKPSRTWLKGVERWAQGAASEVVDDEVLVNDAQIEEAYSKEQPRVATGLDLEKPDYLSTASHKKRRRTAT
ncbi:hypothetical protein GGX14DRAFT_627078 [Mycena pura]|uniref:Uncharacterized protein n=1 Tax=Mycena pura TaxID=153505 RepID=A0AAD7E452_9AGAR|nr:hypothetical protein GGX14DRAFT_627078 [Mycena pura]